MVGSRHYLLGHHILRLSPGIYPTLAMFNHSCDPSIVRFYVEDVVAVQAIKNIRKFTQKEMHTRVSLNNHPTRLISLLLLLLLRLLVVAGG